MDILGISARSDFDKCIALPSKVSKVKGLTRPYGKPSHHTDSSDGSYIWTKALDLMIGCTFSDSVLESWVSGIPACSYSDIGKGRAYLDSVDENLRLYDSESLDRLLSLLKSKEWPSKKIEKDLKSLFGFEYYGNAIPIMLANIKSCTNDN